MIFFLFIGTNIPYKFVWIREMSYMEMFYFTYQAYQLRQYQQGR